jgi:hypothetical protein
MATQIINVFTVHIATLWRWILEQAKDDMLRDPKEDEVVLQAFTIQFYGIEVETYAEPASSLFMSHRLCDLSHHEKYLCYMQKLIIESRKFANPTYIK